MMGSNLMPGNLMPGGSNRLGGTLFPQPML
jgi:hypothetical protein